MQSAERYPRWSRKPDHEAIRDATRSTPPPARRPGRRRRGRILGGIVLPALAGLSLLAGCQQYDVSVEVSGDGSGRRQVTLEAQTPETWPEQHTAHDYLRLHHISSETGWVMPGDFDADADSVSGRVFTRAIAPGGFGDWSRATGDIHIQGFLPEDHVTARQRRAVDFRNRVNVSLVPLEGESLVEYREQFRWEGLRHVIAENYADRFIDELRAIYPSLAAPEVQRIRGVVEGLVQVALEFQDGEEPDDLEEMLARALSVQTFEIVRGRVPEAEPARVDELARVIVKDSEDQLDQFIAQVYPGVHIGWQTRVELSVTMPGEIVDTNADRTEGRTAVWKINSGEAIAAPVTIYARSRQESD